MSNTDNFYTIKIENSDKCADIDANGAVLYIVAQEGASEDQVILLRIAISQIDQVNDHTAAAYAAVDPEDVGEGMIMAGDYSYFAWATGDFPTLDSIIITDDTWYWYVAGESYWYGTVLPLTVDPQEDDAILTADENDDLWESSFSFPISDVSESVGFIQWLKRNDALPIDPSAIRIWDLELDSVSIGNIAYDGSPLVEYSPSRGNYFYDSTTDLAAINSHKITSMIVGSVS